MPTTGHAAHLDGSVGFPRGEGLQSSRQGMELRVRGIKNDVKTPHFNLYYKVFGHFQQAQLNFRQLNVPVLHTQHISIYQNHHVYIQSVPQAVH